MPTANCTNTYIVPTTNHEVTMPSQPAFYAQSVTKQTNVTGDGTVVTVAYNSEILDQNADYNPGTYTFTAPVDGEYVFYFGTQCDNAWACTSFVNYFYVNAGITSQIFLDGSVLRQGVDGAIAISSSELMELDASDTAHVECIGIGVGSKTISIMHTTNTIFCAALVS